MFQSHLLQLSTRCWSHSKVYTSCISHHLDKWCTMTSSIIHPFGCLCLSMHFWALDGLLDTLDTFFFSSSCQPCHLKMQPLELCSSQVQHFLLLQSTAHTTAQANLIKQSNVNMNPHQLVQVFIGLWHTSQMSLFDCFLVCCFCCSLGMAYSCWHHTLVLPLDNHTLWIFFVHSHNLSNQKLECVSSAKFLLCPVFTKACCSDLYVLRACHFDGICQGFGLSHGLSGVRERVNIPLIVTQDWYLWCWFKSKTAGFRYTTIPKI